jgi:hypothetical protein
MLSGNTPGFRRVIVPLLLSAFLLALYWRPPRIITSCDAEIQDLILTRMPIILSEPSARVILVDEDISAEGLYARTVAAVISAVARGNPRSIGVCDCLNGADGNIESAVRRAGKTVIGYGLEFDGKAPTAGAMSAVEKSRIRFSTNPWGRARRWVPAPQAVLKCANGRAIDAAAGCGFATIVADEDGVVRGIPLVAWLKDVPYQGLPVALFTVSLGARRVTLRLKGEAVTGIDLDGLKIATDARGRLLFRECADGIGECSAADVLEGKYLPQYFSDKIVIVGSRGRRLHTRSSPSMPEASVYATAVENILGGHYLRRSRAMGFLEVAMIIAFPSVLARFRGWRRMLAVLGALALVAGSSVILLVLFRQEMRMLYPALAGLFSCIVPQWRRIYKA